MSSHKPVSPLSSLVSSMGSLGIHKTPKILTSDSEEVKLFSVLFNKSTSQEQDFYINRFFKKMTAEMSLKKYYTNTNRSNVKQKNIAINCVKNFLNNTDIDVCIGLGPIGSIKKDLFTTFRAFLNKFKFPTFSPTMSLPQLQLLSMLIFSNSEPKSLSTCNFMVNNVDFTKTTNIQYELGTSKSSKSVIELLDWLYSIGIINNVITNNLDLGKMSSPVIIPVIIPGIKADKGLEFNNTFFVFELENSKNKIITTMKLGTTEGADTNCNFVVIKVDDRSKTETYRWDCKINNMTFYHGCEGAVGIPTSVSAQVDDDDEAGVGGSSKRRYSKSTNKTKRNKRARRTQRRNIKKNKSRRKYGKARNTKRILRRFRQ